MIAGNQFLIGQYRPGKTAVHRLDPRTKIIIVLGVMMATIMSTSLPFYIALITALVTVLASCRLGWRLISGNLKPVLWFVAFTAIFHLLFSGRGEPEIAFSIGTFTVSQKAVSMALIYSTRIFIFVLSTFVVSLTTSPLSLSEAIVSLLKPLQWIKIPVYDLGLILFIALRFIPVLADEIETIRKAQYIRGIDFKGSLKNRIKRSLALILPVFFSALRRADDLSVAIETRGYRSGQPRSSYHPLKFTGLDVLALILTGLAFISYMAGSRWL